MDRLVKLVVVAAIVFVAWKYGVPWVKKLGDRGAVESTADGGGSACVRSAERASEAWGSGLRQFVNPPYNMEAWSSFRGRVESGINAAEADCNCQVESCEQTRGAMHDLRALVNDFDSAIRTGSDASDFVQRQEAIDNRIGQAAELASTGK